MRQVRIVLLIASCVVVLLLAGGAFALKVSAPEGSYREVVVFSEVLSLIMDHYVDPVDADGMLEGAYESMLANLDAHGAFLTPEEVAEWQSDRTTRQADPGLSVIKLQSSLQVVFVAPDSAAAEAGIVNGDQIRSIDGQRVGDLSLTQAVRRLRGEPNSAVDLEVLHPRDFRLETLEVRRSTRQFAAYEFATQENVAVLTLREFPRLDVERLAEELAAVNARGIERLMVDLRAVTEGSPRDALPFMALFAPGSLLRLKDRRGESIEELRVEDRAPVWNGPIAVLVNFASLGGAEAVAALLQSERQATLYGETTYGLGTEPKLFGLPDGSGLLLSAGLWETSAGRSWHESGIDPDHQIAAGGLDEDSQTDQLAQALEAFRESTGEVPQRKAA